MATINLHKAYLHEWNRKSRVRRNFALFTRFEREYESHGQHDEFSASEITLMTAFLQNSRRPIRIVFVHADYSRVTTLSSTRWSSLFLPLFLLKSEVRETRDENTETWYVREDIGKGGGVSRITRQLN